MVQAHCESADCTHCQCSVFACACTVPRAPGGAAVVSNDWTCSDSSLSLCIRRSNQGGGGAGFHSGTHDTVSMAEIVQPPGARSVESISVPDRLHARRIG